jgi:hypothetical protein
MEELEKPLQFVLERKVKCPHRQYCIAPLMPKDFNDVEVTHVVSA